MGFFIGIGVVLVVVIAVALVMDRADRKRSVKRGFITPRGRRARIDDGRWVGNDLATFDPRARPDERAPREDEM
ncbi:hypothetical protein [Amycolatopsis nalaikhensis]|uniref:Secreted protein n=1 Tax=Amycolatopsis nalaikhensis TaxID=715472 RepID=A0ABY8XP39_9PSEU|nr:hypothetical protein [Amycolatopsis sp. 2-2]WIV57363.1 hypothetical protein QP939_01295 [Amycolatopsis sp. 2-2]